MVRIKPAAFLCVLFLFALTVSGRAETKKIIVFIALCDNATQGIVPVGKKIGDGDKPDSNLYWGCSDGLGRYFLRSGKWKATKKESNINQHLLRRFSLEHHKNDMKLIALAYRGSAIKTCLIDFEKAVAANSYDLVAFIGHNGLMDFHLAEQPPVRKNDTDVVVLSCKSESGFSTRIKNLGANPVLLTKQFMYPGSFLLHEGLEAWSLGGSRQDIRSAAARAYAKNQKISQRAALGIFSDFKSEPADSQ